VEDCRKFVRRMNREVNNGKLVRTVLPSARANISFRAREPGGSFDNCVEFFRYVLPRVADTSSSLSVCRNLLRYDYHPCLPCQFLPYSCPTACRRSASWVVRFTVPPASRLFSICLSHVLPVIWSSNTTTSGPLTLAAMLQALVAA